MLAQLVRLNAGMVHSVAPAAFKRAQATTKECGSRDHEWTGPIICGRATGNLSPVSLGEDIELTYLHSSFRVKQDGISRDDHSPRP